MTDWYVWFNRNCSVCVSTTPVEKTVMNAALVTISSHGNLEPSLRETPVKVRNTRKMEKLLSVFKSLYSNTCLPLTCLSLPASGCNCHNKAEDCFYNQTVSELSLSLNTHDIHQGGGVCINCQQNTAGINCETCRDGYYRPTEVLWIIPQTHWGPLNITT